jgi:hypothetical protein
MAGMALGEGGGNGVRGPRALVVPALACAVLSLAGCSGDAPEDPPQPTRPVALHVKTVFGAGALDESTRTELETEVGDVLSRYVVQGFLGEYPRENFVAAFDSFTGGAARRAAEDIDVLTGSPFEDAAAVDATRLNARLSFMADGREVVGATARVAFDFEASLDGGERRPVTLRGRFLLVEEAGTWSIFGYDVARNDGAGSDTGAASS